MARRTPTTRSARGGASSRRRHDQQHEIPAVYRDMLAEADAREPPRPEDQPLKRRRLAGQRSVPSPQPEATPEDTQPAVHVQTVYDSPSDESDMEWEEVDISHTSYNNQTDDTSIQVTLDRPEDRKRKVVSRRRVITAAEKQLRLNIHKVHLLCLLRHVQIRNRWCNHEEVQGFLKRVLSKQIISLLHPSEKRPQQTRSTTFIDGLNQASDVFNRRFRVTAPGLRRPFWIDNPDSLKQRAEHIISDAEVFLSREDFLKQAKTFQGSRDFGAQLFCALLRSVGVEARLVCSLQPLPFSGTTSVAPEHVVATPDSLDRSVGEQRLPQRSNLRRLARPQFASPRPGTPTRKQGSPNVIRESPHPIFWVEALNEAVNKWVPVDTLVTKSLAKPSKFEPPASDPYNVMSYVVAFEDDASARDVTRRYVKAFNAKTRKLRVESVKNHVNWWNRALRFYEKPFLEDRDELEISELTSKMAAEPMPRNIQDFKGHPFYALERHLRRNEVVFPKRVIGQVSLGKSGAKNQILEPVYRRSDVHALRSADRWYRLGRDIKTGEQPLKRVPSRKPQAEPFDEDESVAETPLYAYYQTQTYQPPPVVRGRIPKNMYGNLDVFVPSMVPPGGVHITHLDAAHAAKILAIDYADAVTGFNFKGRHGTAILQGVVIASEYREALEEVMECLESEKMQADLERKSAEALRLWKHFLLKLRIAERVKGYVVEGERESGVDGNSKGLDPEEFGGGFLPEPDAMLDNVPSEETQESMDRDISMSAPEDVLGGGFIPEARDETPLAQADSRPRAPANRSAEFPQYSLVVVPKIETPDQTTSIQGFTGAPNLRLLPERQRQDLGYPPQAGNHPLDASFIKSTPTILEPHQTPSQTESRSPTPGITSQETHSDEETSLLSQDPEDEDAIPEWLMSD
ncbi:Rad4-domain-containing protein [Aspergillus sclerotiicarbonarius CBS 121057]|uniref:Rad4-domain-containing protein n=1 Tax=Aspergillus sclerotiicarbonarius (strain CBS 121057 / IBT 28362) TaxID=1448318 RepID=A0A319EQQ9_ASPSB|nr:Rad4-domain-containing protein [Aspergillus sclerotiicarbonarius CBS 121057]